MSPPPRVLPLPSQFPIPPHPPTPNLIPSFHKATFGDPQSHAEYHALQFTSYLNRFDAGLVIYWFGYDETIDTDARVMILSEFPKGVELLTRAPRREEPRT